MEGSYLQLVNEEVSQTALIAHVNATKYYKTPFTANQMIRTTRRGNVKWTVVRLVKELSSVCAAERVRAGPQGVLGAAASALKSATIPV